MRAQRISVLPQLLREARVGAHLSQKAVAAELGFDQSHWCGIEKGRRPLPREEVLERFATLVRATEEAAQEMRWACTHDRIISQVVKERMPEVAIALLSKCLHATRLLEPAELKGLLATVGSAVASKEELKGLARRARSSGEEAAMT